MSKSHKFIIKGGMLISAIVGLDTRSTMDLDTTIIGFSLSEEKIRNAIKSISDITLDDGIKFHMMSIELIRKDDQYGGYRVRIEAIYDTISTPISIDVSSGDIITPSAIQYEFNSIFDESICIKLWGYNIETILAEKIETILNRGVYNTRPRDYYDIYILATTQDFNQALFLEALAATATHRGSINKISDRGTIISQIARNESLQDMWIKYQNQFSYAKDIRYSNIIKTIKSLLDLS